MNINLQNKIRSNPYLYRYLREHSYWYKELNRDERSLRALELEMKKKYKMTPSDKIGKVNKTIEMIRTVIDVLQ